MRNFSGLKKDITENDRCVSYGDAVNQAKELGCITYMECSALHLDGLDEVIMCGVDSLSKVSKFWATLPKTSS